MHSTPDDSSFHFESFINQSSIIFYQCSLEQDFPITAISPNVKKILGYSPQAFYNDSTSWVDKIHPEERPQIQQAFTKIVEQENRTFVYRIKHANGHWVWLRDENTVIYDDEGVPEGIAGTAVNITSQKQAEQKVKNLNESLEQRIEERTENLTVANRKLKKQIQYRNKAEAKLSEQQDRLRLLQAGINYINDMVIISKAPVDDPLNSEITFVNNAFEKFTGYSFAEVKGKSPAFLHGEKTQDGQLKKLNNHLKNNEAARVEFINYKKDGSTFWVDLEISPFPAPEEGMLYWVGINRNITQRKKAEQQLEKSEKKYRAYTQLSFDAIFEIAEDGTIIDCNARACSLFGYSRQELLGMNTIELTPEQYQEVHPDEITPAHTTDTDVLQRTYKKKDGTTFPCEINTKLFHRDEDHHMIAYVRDISEQVKYQDTIEKSLREKDTLLAEVHHRVKNNLAVISGLLEMQAFNAENEELVNELRESQSRIQSIATVHETLYQSESFSDIALHTYIDELVSYISTTFAHTDSTIHFEKNVAPISLTVKQAVPCGLLLNELITNAYKHAFADRKEGTMAINLALEDGTVQLEVCDDGVGLPDDFSIEKPSSLGMKLIKTLVQQLNGTLSIKTDRADAVSCFHIQFEVER